MPRSRFLQDVTAILDDIQHQLYERARAFQETHTHTLDHRDAFDAYFTPRNSDKPELHGGFALSHWCGDAGCEKEIKETLNVTIRCIPLKAIQEDGACVCCGRPSSERVVWAKAY
jgi:prolyl-tRNA synthetase